MSQAGFTQKSGLGKLADVGGSPRGLSFESFHFFVVQEVRVFVRLSLDSKQNTAEF